MVWAKVWPYLVLTAALVGATVVIYNAGHDAAEATCEAGKSAAKDVVIQKGKAAHEIRAQIRAMPAGAAAVELRNDWSRD